MITTRGIRIRWQLLLWLAVALGVGLVVKAVPVSKAAQLPAGRLSESSQQAGSWSSGSNNAPNLGVTSVPSGTATNTPMFTSTFTPTPIETPTDTPTITLTSTPTCTPGYSYTTASATVVTGTDDIGNHCDDCLTAITLPFSFAFYDASYTTATISSNGYLQFGQVGAGMGEQKDICLPVPDLGPAIFAHWDDMRTDVQPGCSAYPGGCGIFTSVSGSAPNRIFNIEWRATYYGNSDSVANFEVRLYEGAPSRFDIILGRLDDNGARAITGAQDGAEAFTQFSCNTQVPNNIRIVFTFNACGSTPTTTPIATDTPTSTATGTPTRTPTPLLVGHVTWQGPPAQPDPRQQMPVTLTLKLGAIEVNYPSQNTDASGFFTVSLGGLPAGTYEWRAKGPKFLANGGTVNLAGAPSTQAEMGLMRAGDANNDNLVSGLDFNIIKRTFGLCVGDPAYDARGDFDNSNCVSVLDFNLLKVNFGFGGVPPVVSRKR